MEEIMKQKLEDYGELLLMQKSAHAARDLAQTELQRVSNDLAANRQKYEGIITEKKGKLQKRRELREQQEYNERDRQMV
jgi:hypothetical protein